MKYWFHYVKGTCYLCDVDHRADAGLVGFLHYTLSPMCPLCALWKDVHTQPLMSGKRCPTSSRAEYLHKLGFFCIGDLSFLSCLFTFQSFFNLYDIYFSSLGYKSSIACVLSCVQLFANPWTVTHQALLSMGFPGKSTQVGCHFLLQGIFPTQGSSPHLLHWQVDSLPLSHTVAPALILRSSFSACGIYSFLNCNKAFEMTYTLTKLLFKIRVGT